MVQVENRTERGFAAVRILANSEADLLKVVELVPHARRHSLVSRGIASAAMLPPHE
jgi:hypothetical protein